MFGMTDFDPSTFPQAPVGAVRLWDSGVTWREIETSPGVFDFSRLDVAVSTARNRGADVLHRARPDAHSSTPCDRARLPSTVRARARRRG